MLVNELKHPWKKTSSQAPIKQTTVLISDGEKMGVATYLGKYEGRSIWDGDSKSKIEPVFWRHLPDLPEPLTPLDRQIW